VVLKNVVILCLYTDTKMYTFIIKHTKIQGTPMLSTFLLGQPQLTKLSASSGAACCWSMFWGEDMPAKRHESITSSNDADKLPRQRLL